jgi:uncharacterized protein YdbL (DUF1318 family)
MLKRMSGFVVLGLFLAACVTINIYFPAAEAEEAARTIVREVLQKDEPKEKGDSPAGDKSSAIDLPEAMLVLSGRVLTLMVAPAQAAQPNIDINTPAIDAIRASMRKRQGQLAGFYRSGAIGFDNDGSVSLRDLGAVELRDRNRVKQLVSDENRDRDALYREIARANGHPEWEQQIRQTFAKVWVDEAPSGYWFNAGGWRKK